MHFFGALYRGMFVLGGVWNYHVFHPYHLIYELRTPQGITYPVANTHLVCYHPRVNPAVMIPELFKIRLQEHSTVQSMWVQNLLSIYSIVLIQDCACT